MPVVNFSSSRAHLCLTATHQAAKNERRSSAGSPPNLFAKKKNFLLNLVPRAKAAVHHCFWGHERLPCTTPSGIVGRIMEFFPKDQWSRYDYNGCLSTGQLSRMGRFENAAGLSIAFYSWEVPNPKGVCLLYTSPSPRDATLSRMPSSA